MTGTIDLGVLAKDEARPRGPIFPPRARRAGLGVIVAVLCLLSLGASAIGDRGFRTPLWTDSGGRKDFSLGSDVLFSTRSDEGAVIARDLRTGDHLWEFEVAGRVVYTMDVGGGVTAITTLPPGVTDRFSGNNTMTLVRTRTGERIGQIDGVAGGLRSDGRTMLVHTFRGDCGDQTCLTLTGWDLATSKPVWHIDESTRTVLDFSTGDEVVTLGGGGVMQLRDPASGAVLTSAALPEIGGRDQAAMFRDALITTNRDIEGDRTTVTGYARSGLTPIWSFDVATVPGDGPLGSMIWLSGCGDDACLHLNDGGVRLIDPATGTVKAESALSPMSRLGNGAFLANPQERTNMSLAGTQVPGLILDSRLRVLSDLRVDDEAAVTDSRDRALFMRYHHDPDQTTFLEVDQEGRQQSLGSVSGAQLTCEARGRHLACTDVRGRLRVWQLPSDWAVSS